MELCEFHRRVDLINAAVVVMSQTSTGGFVNNISGLVSWCNSIIFKMVLLISSHSHLYTMNTLTGRNCNENKDYSLFLADQVLKDTQILLKQIPMEN